MFEDVEPRVSLSLDPGTWTGIEGYNDDSAKFVGCAVNAVSYIQQTLGQLHDVKRLWTADGSVTKETATIMVGKDAAKRKQRALQMLDGADQTLNAHIVHTEKMLLEPLIEQAGRGAVNGEVRAHAKKMEPGEREAFMNDLLERDDEPSLAAILGAQFYLSGLTQLDQEHYLRAYHTKKRPDLVRRLDVMKRFSERLRGVGPIVHEQFQLAVGAHPNVVADLARAHEQAVASLAAEPSV